MATMTATGVSLELGHDGDCHGLSGPLFLQLSRGNYDRCSVLPIPDTVDLWRDEHRTARKRASRAERLGYRFEPIHRHEFSDDIHRINVSLPERQGRPMSRSYMETPSFAPLPDYPCPRHRINTYGILTGSRLVAYLWLYRVGDLALVSSILGHGSHLAGDVMYLLMQGCIDQEAAQGGSLVYNRHDSGTNGLRFFKERCGFQETTVEWLP